MSNLNCNCIEELEVKLAERYTKELGKPATVSCQSIGYSMGTTPGMLHRTIFAVKADAPGFRRLAGKEVSFYAAYCPICGKKTGEPT